MEVEIIRQYKACWQIGQRRDVADEFAAMLIEAGYAVPVSRDDAATEKDEHETDSVRVL